MASSVDALKYLAKPEKHPPRPVCVLFGDDAFLRRQALLHLREVILGEEEGDLSLTSYEGKSAQWRDVRDELSTMAMFGGRRLVVVEEADKFVTDNRLKLEQYVEKPAASSILVLDVKSFPGNTKLAKAVAADGLPIDCNAPKAAALGRWLGDWGEQVHQVRVSSAAADLLLEMIGPELGLLDQELAKLALTAGPKKEITPQLVERSVGSWRAKTVWVMLDEALAGKAAEALRQLDRLLVAGEEPIGILAQISFSLRRLAAATRLVLQAEEAGRGVKFEEVLAQLGLKPYFIPKTKQQLLRLGRERGKRLYDWLLQADLDLKGASNLPPRMVLERLILRLAASRDTAGVV